MTEVPDYKITELDPAASVDTSKDYLAVVHYSDVYQTGNQTVKVHPEVLMSYDNKKSHLNARTYQDAIDEIVNLMEVGQTFNVPLSPNPNADEIQVASEPVPELATFNGDGTTTSFTISTASTITGIATILVDYATTTAYTFDAGAKTVTFTSAPPLGTGNVHIHYWVENGG